MRIFEDVLMSTMMCLIMLIDFLVSCNGFNFYYLESIALILIVKNSIRVSVP